MAPRRHPFQRYPYQGYPAPSPKYVGPRWAAPGPRSPLPRRSSTGPAGCGCLLAAVLVGVPLLLVACLVIAGGLWVAYRSGEPEPSGETPVPTVAPTTTSPPPPKRGLPTPPVDPVPTPDESTITRVVHGGACGNGGGEELGMLDHYPTYWRSAGSAPALRGRVLIVHFRLGSTSLRWTPEDARNTLTAALVAQRFHTNEAKRYGIGGLRYETVSWPVETYVVLPPLNPDTSNLLSDTAMKQLERLITASIESALTVSLKDLVAGWRAQGYAGIGFVMHVPVKTPARCWASPVTHFTPSDAPEITVVFAARHGVVGLAETVSHEILHLFGAADLYRMPRRAPGDENDVMNDMCSGLRDARIGDATAYAIGWLDQPPARPYPFRD